MVLALTLAAATLLPGDLPEAERVKRLTPYFSPPPGGTFALDPTEIRDLERKRKPLRLRGFITVKPPKGTCFIVQKGLEEEDVEVCKERQIPFTLEDSGRDGKIRWQVKTGDGDFGTPLVWSSPYRLAMVIPFDAKPDDPMEYRFVTGCDANLKAPGGGRRLSVRFLGGESWIVRFPDTDEMLPQPEAPANLFIYQAGGKVSLTQAAAKQHKDEGSAADDGQGSPDAGAPQDGHGSAPASEHGNAPPPPKKKVVADGEPIADPNSQTNDRTAWSIPLRNAYTMGASYFQPRGSVPPGMQGRCRYIYDSGADDPGVGRLECHEGDYYKFALVPLTCLRQLKR